MQTKTMNTNPSSPGKVDHLQRLVNDLARYYSTCDHFCTEQLGITASQGTTLLAMPDAGSVMMNELSVQMKLATSTMTRMADLLIQKGMIERQADPGDRRVVRVSLTENGRRVKAQLKGALQDLYSQVLAAIPEGEQNSVLVSLEKLNSSILCVVKACCGPEL
jgi:DNA-binding MarR family transcriptional regulator